MESVGLALLHSLWQGVVIWAAAWVVLRLASHRARLRYGVLCVALLAMVLAPAVTAYRLMSGPSADSAAPSPVVAIDRPSAPTEAPAAGPTRVQPAADRSFDWRAVSARALPVLATVWLVGVLLGLARIAGGSLAVRRLVARAGPAPAALADRAAAIAGFLGLRRPIELLVSTEISVPFAAGVLRPVVMIPVAALSGLSPVHLDAILAHELAHVRRWDYLVNLLQTTAETLLFFHPVAWWLSRRIRIEREYCCDDLAVAAVLDPIRYARALTELEGLRGTLPRLATAFSAGSLGDRVTRLVTGEARRATTGWLPVTAAIMLFVTAAAVSQVRPTRLSPSAASEAAIEPGAGRGEVLRHPDPSEPLRRRIEWAHREASRRGWSRATIAWGIRSASSDGDLVTSSTDGGSFGDPGAPISTLLRPDRATGVVILGSFQGREFLAAVALRSVDAPYTGRSEPVLWLGPAEDRESIAELERLAATAPGRLRSELAAAVTLHDDRASVLAAARRFLADEDPAVRAELTAWLPRVRSAEARRLVERSLDDPSPLVRDEALSALRDGPDGRAAVLDALESPYPDVRSEAVQALAETGGVGAEETVRLLRRAAFEDPSRAVQSEAVDALIDLGGSAAQNALREIRDHHGSSTLRLEAGEALAGRGRR